MTPETGTYKTTFTERGDTELVATRVFDAPRQTIWDAHTKCDLVQRWLVGPEGGSMPACEMDLRPGGKWRYVYRGGDGVEFTMSGEYREVVEPERIVNTETYNDLPGATLNTLTLTEEGGKTTITTVVVYPSKEVRAEVIATGMEDGWAESYDRLDEELRRM